MGVSHIAFNFILWCQCRYGIHNNEINCSGARQSFQHIQCLLSKVWLRDEEIVGIDTEIFGIGNIQGMLGIDKSTDHLLFLGRGDGLECQRSFARGLRPIDLYDTPLGDTADS